MRFEWKWTALLGICCIFLSGDPTARAEVRPTGDQPTFLSVGDDDELALLVGADQAIADIVSAPPIRTVQGSNPACVGAAGSCSAPHPTPGCSNPICCNAVCDLDPFCCDIQWDPTCVAEAAATAACCSNSTCSGDSCCITQNTVNAANFNVVACGIAAPPQTTENGFARCFNMAQEGVSGDFVIDSVQFGLRALIVYDECDVVVEARIYSVPTCVNGPCTETDNPGSTADDDDCIPIGTATLLATQSIVLTVEDTRRVHTVPFPGGVAIPAGSNIMVEIFNPDDGTEAPGLFTFRPMATQLLAQSPCADSYLRNPDGCGADIESDWTNLVTIGFPSRRTIISATGHLAGGGAVVCGDGYVGGCEGCDDGNTACGDGCDNNCEVEAAVCGDGVKACTEACDTPPASATGQAPFAGESCNAATCQAIPICGNDIIDPGEGCDGCNSDCSASGSGYVCNATTCQCDPPFCGDDSVNVPGEECDGADDGACVGLCLSNCTCLDTCEECKANSTYGANDCCCNRSDIADGSTSFSTVGANTDGVDNPAGLCNDSGSTQTYNDIWYNYVASCTGTLTVTTCEELGGSADYDSDIVVYNGCDACAPSAADIAGCNDDDPDHPCGTTLFHSTVNIPVCEGQCYKIRVGGWGPADVGMGNLNVVCEGAGCVATGAPNDCCSASSPIDNGDTPVNTTGANTDGPPNPAGLCNDFGSTQTYHDVWFDYVADCNGSVTVSTCEDTGGSASYDTDLVVYDGCDCCNLELLACNDDDPNNPCGNNLFHSTVTFDAVAGNCYKVRVGGWGQGDQGAAVVNISKGGCQSDADCDDNDPCTFDSCTDCACVNAELDCPEGTHCVGGECVTGAVQFPLDIKPHKCPNKIKYGTSAAVWVVVLGTADLDAAQIATVNLRVCGGSDSVSGTPRIKDWATPYSPQACGDGDCTCHDEHEDGIDDVRVKFSVDDFEALIGPAAIGTSVEMEVFGLLDNGDEYTASDCVLVDRNNGGP